MLRLIRRIISLGIFVSCLSTPSFAFYPLGVHTANSLSPYSFAERDNDFIQFQAIQDKHVVLLTWEMLDDDTGSVFLVERKTGQADFRIIGGVNARNMKGINRKFSFQDQLPSKGNVAYRIRRESKQNIIFYSPVQELIRIQTAEIQLFNSLPGEDLHFQFELTQSAPYQIRLMDLQGRQLFYEESRANFGPSVHGRIPSSHLEKGLFLLQITTAQRRMTERILLR